MILYVYTWLSTVIRYIYTWLTTGRNVALWVFPILAGISSASIKGPVMGVLNFILWHCIMRVVRRFRGLA